MGELSILSRNLIILFNLLNNKLLATLTGLDIDLEVPQGKGS